MKNLSDTIEIHVSTKYLPEQSNPARNRYVFAYSIEITNKGVQTAKLLNRRWHIKDDNNKVQEIVGEGVIGQKPEIPPGKSFNYTSGTIIETEFGIMHGSYEMQLSSGEKFNAPIPPFLLSLPHAIH